MLYLEYFPPPVVFVRPQWEPGSVLCVLHLSVLGEKQGFSELITGPFLRSRSLRVMRLLNALFLSNSYSNYIPGLGIFNTASDR